MKCSPYLFSIFWQSQVHSWFPSRFEKPDRTLCQPIKSIYRNARSSLKKWFASYSRLTKAKIKTWRSWRGDLLYIFLCVILFLCFSVLLVLRLLRLGKRELILVLFVRLFGLCLFRFVGFLILLGSGKGCGLWLWHSLDFSLTFFTWPFF